MNLPYRPNVCLVILNSKGQIFIGERNLKQGHWQLPQGGVEQAFSLAENALREASEELGVDLHNFEVIKQLKATHQYDFTDPPEYARNKWRGQDQTFWVLRFNGKDEDIQLDRHEPEFSAWDWCDAEDLLSRTIELRHVGYKKILPEIMECLNEC